MYPGWHFLPLQPSRPWIPPLLVKFDDDSGSGYEILITDLTRVWSETLNRRQIIKRALLEETSIDPSEDPSQLKILIDKIQETLIGEDGSSLEIIPNGQSAHLELRVSRPLPPPLKALQWRFRLEQASPEVLTDQLVAPLLSSLVDRDEQVKSLLDQIRMKDNVIARLTDKMSSSGTDLSTVFPGVAAPNKPNQRIVTREAVGRYVRGLGEFKVSAWRDEVNAVLRTQELSGLMTEVFNGKAAIISNSGVSSIKSTHRNWWEVNDLDPKSITLDGDVALETSKPPLVGAWNLKKNNDKPQTPGSPAYSIKHEGSSNIDSVRNSIIPSPTEAGNIDDGSRAPASIATSVRSKSRLGTIGGRKKVYSANDRDTPAFPKVETIQSEGRSANVNLECKASKSMVAVPQNRMQQDPSPSQEDPKERADRKREELKKRLGESSNAIGKKKKKRF